MLETKTKTKKATKNGKHEIDRLPKASDFKLPKKLTKKQKALIDTSRAILEEFRKVRERQQAFEK